MVKIRNLLLRNQKVNTRKNDEDFNEVEEKSEWDEWKEDDDARRYREWESDQRRPY